MVKALVGSRSTEGNDGDQDVEKAKALVGIKMWKKYWWGSRCRDGAGGVKM